MHEDIDVLVIGAGAAGLMAAIFAGRAGARVVAVDGARRIGAKILIAGGGRCNVTHHVVTAADFNGNRNTIARILRTFPVEATVGFFEEIGVRLAREETGKLFPVTNRAATVLRALLEAAGAAGAQVLPGHRVEAVVPAGGGFVARTAAGSLSARRVILATGGRSVPKTGSDGSGYGLARALGHGVTEVFPALVPLVLPAGHFLTALSGTSAEAELEVRSGSGAVLARERGSMLFTHFGLSGPAVLDISRHWILARKSDGSAGLTANLLPGRSFGTVEERLLGEARRNPRATVASFLRPDLAERLLEACASYAGVGPATPLSRLRKEQRRQLVRALVALPLPVERDRGFEYAEVTAGGVDLGEIDPSTMRSRVQPGLFLCGEILNVDGRIGGFNFQWAWTTGRLAGMAAAGTL